MATALSVQVVVIGPGTACPADQPGAAVGDACATCVTATAAFQVVAQVDAVGRLPDPALAEVSAWFARRPPPSGPLCRPARTTRRPSGPPPARSATSAGSSYAPSTHGPGPPGSSVTR